MATIRTQLSMESRKSTSVNRKYFDDQEISYAVYLQSQQAHTPRIVRSITSLRLLYLSPGMRLLCNCLTSRHLLVPITHFSLNALHWNCQPSLAYMPSPMLIQVISNPDSVLLLSTANHVLLYYDFSRYKLDEQVILSNNL
jgi:hypothetical protein